MGPHFLWAGVVLTLAGAVFAFLALKQRLFQQTEFKAKLQLLERTFDNSSSYHTLQETKLADRLAALERGPAFKRPTF